MALEWFRMAAPPGGPIWSEMALKLAIGACFWKTPDFDVCQNLGCRTSRMPHRASPAAMALRIFLRIAEARISRSIMLVWDRMAVPPRRAPRGAYMPENGIETGNWSRFSKNPDFGIYQNPGPKTSGMPHRASPAAMALRIFLRIAEARISRSIMLVWDRMAAPPGGPTWLEMAFKLAIRAGFRKPPISRSIRTLAATPVGCRTVPARRPRPCGG